MLKKKTNLAVALDMTDTTHLIEVANLIGSHVCIIKIHSDTWDFNEVTPTMNLLTGLSQKYQFLIMDDRKIADIGQTCCNQIDKLNQSDCVTIHSFSVTPQVLEKNMGLVIIETMSHDQGKQIMDQSYVEKSQDIINDSVSSTSVKDTNLLGYVTQDASMKNTYENPYLYMTPGVNLNANKVVDQNYISVEEAFARRADIIIVGRDIWQQKNSDIVERTKLYQKRGWESVNVIYLS